MPFPCGGCRRELGCVTGLLMAYLGLQDMKPGSLSSNQEDIFLVGNLIPFLQSKGNLRFSLKMLWYLANTIVKYSIPCSALSYDTGLSSSPAIGSLLC